MRQKESALEGGRGQRGREEHSLRSALSISDPDGARDHQISHPSAVSRSSSCSHHMAALRTE